MVEWIDHYVTTTEDVERWAAFHARVLGAVRRDDNVPGVFQQIASTRHGGFRARTPLPPTLGVGAGLPRYAYYVHAADIDAHVRRLQDAGAPHAGPQRTARYGEPGVAVEWQDPDGNQFEFWAPDVLAPGAMRDENAYRIGRISHGVFESRDLARTASFFKQYCELEPLRSAGIAPNVLVLPLGTGGRLVFHEVRELGGRTTGLGLRDAHTALLVHADRYLPLYRRLWAGVPEWDYDPSAGVPIADGASLPARTVLHPSPAGRKFHALTGRGDDFFDWDTNMFHFYGGVPDGTSFASYRALSVEAYLTHIEAAGPVVPRR